MKKLLTAVLLALPLSAPAQNAGKFSVVLDTGHTEKHYGALSPSGRTEFSYNKAMVNALQRHLQADGTKVILVPNDQPELSLIARTAYATDSDLFVSVHHDSFPEKLNDQRERLKGFSVFVSAKNPYYKQSLACAKAVAAQLRRAGEVRSRYHGWNIEGERKLLLDECGVYRYDNLVVLKTAQMPAILVEVGVIANPREDGRLAQPAVRERLAQAIAQGIDNCKNAVFYK